MKKLKLLLVVILIFAFIPMKESFAYDGGLLGGVPFNYGDNIDSSNGSTLLITDNNENTGYTITNTSGNKYAWVSVDSIDIGSIRFKGSTQMISFYNGSTLLFRLNPATYIDGTLFPIETLKGVTKISIFGGATVYEFDVFPPDAPTPTPTPTPTPEPSSGDRAMLTLTLVTGIEKEFDLPISEIDTFLNWYDSASGTARYGIDKHDNNKGPFSKRTEYVIHDKILTFEVSEYTAAE